MSGLNTFELELTEGVWVEILKGKTYLAFDGVSSKRPEVFFSTSLTPPSAEDKGVVVETWPGGWDFEQSGLTDLTQKIYVRGSGIIRGVR